MNKSDFIDLIEPTPKLTSTKCRLLALFIQLALQYATYLIGALTWYVYDYFIAGAALVLGYIITGIVRSKLRNSSIPLSQREYQYNDEGISRWYVARNLC